MDEVIGISSTAENMPNQAMAQIVKNLPADARDVGSILGSGRSPGEGNGNPFQYSCLQNPMDRETRQPTVLEGAEKLDMTKQLSLSQKMSNQKMN